MSDKDVLALKLCVRGVVQGVGYRFWAERAARDLCLDGWIRNRKNGRVELLVSGAPDAVRKMVEACETGPLFARVWSVDQEPADPPAEPGFHRLPTS